MSFMVDKLYPIETLKIYGLLSKWIKPQIKNVSILPELYFMFLAKITFLEKNQKCIVSIGKIFEILKHSAKCNFGNSYI